jgi:hypothetical protein
MSPTIKWIPPSLIIFFTFLFVFISSNVRNGEDDKWRDLNSSLLIHCQIHMRKGFFDTSVALKITSEKK